MNPSYSKDWIDSRFEKMEEECLPFFEDYGAWDSPTPLHPEENVTLGEVGQYLSNQEAERSQKEKLEAEKARINKKLVCSSDGFDCLR